MTSPSIVLVGSMACDCYGGGGSQLLRPRVTESNVKSHLTSAFSKLGVSSRNAAAELILDHESGLGPGILRISPEE